jgi:subtilisin family serine protease
MKRRILRLLALTALSVSVQLIISNSAKSGTQKHRYVLRVPADSASSVAANHGLTLAFPPDSRGISLAVQSDDRTPEQVLAEVSSDPAVANIENDQGAVIPETNSAALNQSAAAVAGALAGNTPVSYYGASVWTSYVNQPAVFLTRLPSIQSIPITGDGTVAVIDTGVDPSQPILQGVLVPGYDFVNNGAGIPSELSDLDPASAAIINQSTAAILDKNTVVQVNQSTAAILDQSTAAILDVSHLPSAFGHGTMVAGIIHLVAPTAQIMPIKAFKDDGTGDLSDVVKSIYFAVDNGARIINMSFSIAGFSLELMKALNYASSHGVICVSSVGNGGSETYVYPAAFQNVIGVASTDNQDRRSSFSNFGAALAHMAAPGEGILTTYPGGGYAIVSGTSFAAPFVAGGAALMVQIDEDLDRDEAEQAFSNAKKLSADLGYGRLDLYSAVRSLMRH